MTKTATTGLISRAIPISHTGETDIVFRISDESPDEHGTVFLSDGWDLSRYMKNPIVTYGHPDMNSADPDVIIGRSEIFFDDGEMYARFIPEEGNELAEKVVRKINNKTLNMASIRARVHDGDYGNSERGEDPEIFYFTRHSLLDWGIVMHGSNPNALNQRSVVDKEIERIMTAKGVTENTQPSDNHVFLNKIEAARSIINHLKKSIKKMRNLDHLYEELESHEGRLADLNEQIRSADDTTEEHRTSLNKVLDDIEATKAKIELAKRNEQALADAAKNKMKARAEKKTSPEEKVRKEYSLFRAIKAKADGKPLTGLELEMHQEAEIEARESGNSIRGIGIPSVVQRVETAGTAATAGNLIPTDLGEFMPALYPKLKLAELGATFLPGLRGNLDLPIGDGLAAAAFATEQGSAAETTPSTRKVSLSPKRLAAYIDVTMQLLNQGRSVENWVMTELYRAEARKVEDVAIEGGGSNEPSGILDNSLLAAADNTIAIGTDGGALTRALLLQMEREIADDNADDGSFNFLTTPGVREKMKGTVLDAGSGRFVWEDNELIGYPAHISNLVPSDLSKGAGTNLHAIIFGNWARLLIASWGVRDLIVNPYTKAKTGTIELVLNSFWDVNLTHWQAFSVIKDIDLTA